MPGAEGDLELQTEEQVLDEEALAPAQDAGECGEDELEKFDHRGRIADRCSPRGGAQTFCPPAARRSNPPTMLMGNLLELLKPFGPGDLSPTADVMQLATAVPRGSPWAGHA